jgi:hypothetical protein
MVEVQVGPRAGEFYPIVSGLKPGEVREVRCGLRWSADWKADETAMAEFDAGGGRTISRPIIPNRFRLHRAKDLVIDGRLDDWPAAARMPAWMLGSTSGEADARVCLAWAPEGLYGAVEVPGAVLDKTDPRSFWEGNCLEIFIDSRNEKRDRAYEPGDHQFWFVPLVEEKRVYVGQWKRGSELAQTRYDIQGIRGVALAKGDGYVMEFLLPAAEIQKFKPAAGGTIGLNLNLTIKDKQFTREVYWPAPKSLNIQVRPAPGANARERAEGVFLRERLGRREHVIMLAPRSPFRPSFGPLTIPEGYYFVMGDNRDDSADSRVFGFVERHRIVGRATAVVFSLDRQNHWAPRAARLLRPLT